jgi:hypothetical protein
VLQPKPQTLRLCCPAHPLLLLVMLLLHQRLLHARCWLLLRQPSTAAGSRLLLRLAAN